LGELGENPGVKKCGHPLGSSFGSKLLRLCRPCLNRRACDRRSASHQLHQ
jgi:hypothetical protein